jgi:hypothetical protein
MAIMERVKCIGMLHIFIYTYIQYCYVNEFVFMHKCVYVDMGVHICICKFHTVAAIYDDDVYLE